MSRYLTYREAMNYMNIRSYVTLNKMIKDGLPAIRIGNTKRIDKEAIDDYFASNATN